MQIRGWPWDIVIADSYTVIAGALLLTQTPGSLWFLPLTLFAPGYVLVSVLFPGRGLSSRLRQLAAEGELLLATAKSFGMDPRDYGTVLERARASAQAGRLSEAVTTLKEGNARLRTRLEDFVASRSTSPVSPGAGPEVSEGGLDWTARVVLAFGLSIAITSLVGIALHITPWGITLPSIVSAVILFTVVFGFVGIARRLRLPPEDRLLAGARRWRRMSTRSTVVDKALVLCLAASIVFAGAVLSYVALSPRPSEQLSWFFLLDSNGTADPARYPRRLNVSEPGTVIIVLVNNESVRNEYVIRVDLVGVESVYNPTTRLNETIERNRTTRTNFAIALESGDDWRQNYTFTIDASGDWIVEFLLFRGVDFTGQHLRLRLQVLPRS